MGSESVERDVTYLSIHRGYLVALYEGAWYYEDGVMVDDDPDRVCPRCLRPPTPEGFDACLGRIPNCVSACCGHGAHEPFFLFGETN